MTHPELFPPIGSDKKSDRSSQRFRLLELEVFSLFLSSQTPDRLEIASSCNAVFLITRYSEWSCFFLFLLFSSRAAVVSALHHRVFYELSQSPASNQIFRARRSRAHSSCNRAPAASLWPSIATQLRRLTNRTGFPRLPPSTRSVFLGILFSSLFFLCYVPIFVLTFSVNKQTS